MERDIVQRGSFRPDSPPVPEERKSRTSFYPRRQGKRWSFNSSLIKSTGSQRSGGGMFFKEDQGSKFLRNAFFGEGESVLFFLQSCRWKRTFLSLYLLSWGLLLTIKIAFPPPRDFLVHGAFHWIVTAFEVSLFGLLFTRRAFLASILGTVFFFFGGLFLVLFPPHRPCGCLGAIRLGDGLHMLLLGVLGSASLFLACQLGDLSWTKAGCPCRGLGRNDGARREGAGPRRGRDAKKGG